MVYDIRPTEGQWWPPVTGKDKDMITAAALREEIEKTKKLRTAPQNQAERDQFWIMGRLNGLKTALQLVEGQRVTR